MKHSKITLFILLFFASTLFAQGQMNDNLLENYLREHNIAAQSGPEGIFYQIEKQGTGPVPQRGDYVQIRYTGKLLDGSVFDQSKEDQPIVFELGRRQVIRGWEIGIPIFRKGGKGVLYLPSEVAYGKRGAGKAIAPNTPLIFDIEVIDIMDIDAYDRYMEAQEAKERAAFERHMAEQFQKDKQLIRDYVKTNKLKAKQTSSGLNYVITKKGKGKQTAKPGDVLEVVYEGFLLDGQSFDKAGAAKPYRFTLGKGKTIKGWEEGLQYFKRASEGWLIIPSKLAYGPRPIIEEDVHVPANSVLVFKIKVTKLERGE